MQILHLQILGKTEEWSYTRKISHKSCDSVIVRSRMTAPLASSVVVQELKFAINRALSVFCEA